MLLMIFMTVLPGEKIGAIEEYVPSEGTYSTDDTVYSSKFGTNYPIYFNTFYDACCPSTY